MKFGCDLLSSRGLEHGLVTPIFLGGICFVLFLLDFLDENLLGHLLICSLVVDEKDDAEAKAS